MINLVLTNLMYWNLFHFWGKVVGNNIRVQIVEILHSSHDQLKMPDIRNEDSGIEIFDNWDRYCWTCVAFYKKVNQ